MFIYREASKKLEVWLLRFVTCVESFIVVYFPLTILTNSVTSSSKNLINASSSCITKSFFSSIISWILSSSLVVLPSSLIMFMSFDAASINLRGPYKRGSSTQPLALVMRKANSLKCSSLTISSVLLVVCHLFKRSLLRGFRPLVWVAETQHQYWVYVFRDLKQFFNSALIKRGYRT